MGPKRGLIKLLLLQMFRVKIIRRLFAVLKRKRSFLRRGLKVKKKKKKKMRIDECVLRTVVLLVVRTQQSVAIEKREEKE